jgi:hypothetical protein
MQFFAGKPWLEPGAGATIITDLAPSPNFASTGVVAVLAECDGGLTYEDQVVYESSNPNNLKSIIRSGVGSRVIDFIFNPSKDTPGAQKVYFIRTQVATKATSTITQSTGGVSSVTMTSRDKGSYLSNATLGGLKWQIIAGTQDATKDVFVLTLNGATIWYSQEVATYDELKAAIEGNTTSNNLITFVINSGGTNNIDDSVRSTAAMFTGGSQTAMTGTDVDAALNLVKNLSPNLVYIASDNAAFHTKVLSYCNNLAELPCKCYFGGALNETKAQTITRAQNLNNEVAALCWPDIVVPTVDGLSNEVLSPMYLAAKVTGLRAGLASHVPLTWKTVDVIGFRINGGDLDKTGREDLIRFGVMFGRNIPGIGFGINKGINTLQNNGSMIYKKTDGTATSPEDSIISIKQLLIRELILNSAPMFIGGTVATVSKLDIENFTSTYLSSRISQLGNPNALISFSGVTAELRDDAWWTYFSFTPNTPINFTFFIGAMLKP